jgi:ElaB/YqjD/DUF883 family membrane-anchored ribosome-binding protein
MTELTAAHKEKLMADLRVVIADAEDILRITADQAGEGLADVRGRMQLRLAQAKADLAHLQEVAVAKARAAGQAADQYVHENPWRAIGVAAGFGLLVGLLISRR